MNPNLPRTAELLEAIVRWTEPLVDHEAFRALRRSKIGRALDWADDFTSKRNIVSEVVMPEALNSQHNVVMQFYYLRSSYERIRQSEFYFIKYPFKPEFVSKHEHLENICNMFFSGFYIFEERLKSYLNALNKVTARQIDVAGTLKQYKKRFRRELRARNDVVHLEPFDDATISAVMLRTLLAFDPGDARDHAKEAAYIYRKASREWAEIARMRAIAVAEFLEAVAEASLEIATFLKVPPEIGPNELKVR